MVQTAFSSRAALLLACSCLAVSSLAAQNIVPNPDFAGSGGQVRPIEGGIVNAPSGVPDNWRAFAAYPPANIDLEIVPVAADELFPGSPATNAVLLRLNGVGVNGDQGFDDDNGIFPIVPGLDYHAEFYVKSANTDASDQAFNFGFPLFNKDRLYLGIEPGGSGGIIATAAWTLFEGPHFTPADPAAQGHISWRCIQDGGEDAILLAQPFVTGEGTPVLPSGLDCTRTGIDVGLSWQNNAVYSSLKILRDAVEIAPLAVDATAYTDVGPPDGVHTYQVLATIGPETGGPTCEVAVFRPPALGTRVSVNLNDVDLEEGMVNSVRGEGTDGENGFVICGPEADLREARSNFSGEDPVPDAPDAHFYFTVTDPRMKGQEQFRLELTAYDDPLLAGVPVSLQFTNKDSTGPTDIPNTFYPLEAPPTVTLAGTGGWVTLSWDIENAGFRSFQQGAADFRLGVGSGARLCADRADLIYFPAPTGLTCRRESDSIEIGWTNNGAYDNIKVLRNGTQLAQIPGNAAAYVDGAAPEGDNEYRIIASAGGVEGGPRCNVTVFFVPQGTRVEVDLGDADTENGLSNTVRTDPGDGENEFVLCGPEADLREARSNLAGTDPGPDAPDGVFYFTVTEPEMKAQVAFQLEVTIYDDPARAGAGLALQYTIQDATGPGDIPNTFFPLENPPVKALGGTGAWVVLAWEIENAGFRSFQQGLADFRLSVTDGGRVCIDKVELTFGQALPQDPLFHRGDADTNGSLQLTDAVRILNVLFLGTGVILCTDAADADDNGSLQLTDAVRILNVLFLGTGVIPPPGPPDGPCGVDTTADDLVNGDCVYAQCGE